MRAERPLKLENFMLPKKAVARGYTSVSLSRAYGLGLAIRGLGAWGPLCAAAA